MNGRMLAYAGVALTLIASNAQSQSAATAKAIIAQAKQLEASVRTALDAAIAKRNQAKADLMAQAGQTNKSATAATTPVLTATEAEQVAKLAAGTDISSLNLQGMDLQTAILTVQSQRAEALANELKNEIVAIQARNEKIERANEALGVLKRIAGQFPAGAFPTTKTSAVAKAADLAAWETAAKAADVQNLSIATKATLTTALNSLNSQVDALTSAQQQDMLRLQSLSNKRNEAFDLMANFLKKMQDSRSNVLNRRP